MMNNSDSLLIIEHRNVVQVFDGMTFKSKYGDIFMLILFF